MIKLNDKYYIDVDALNYILKEKLVGKDGKNIGKEYYKNIAYFGKMEHLFERLIDINLRENITILDNIKDIANFKREMLELINKTELTIEAKFNRPKKTNLKAI